MKQKIVILFLAVGIYFLSIWIEDVATRKFVNQEANSSTPNSFFTHFYSKAMDKQGILTHTIEGEVMLHFQDKHAEIKKPVVELHEEKQVNWVIKSDNASIQEKDDSIHFMQDVLAKNSDTEEKQLIIKTDDMLLLHKENIMKSDKAISIESNSSYTTAIGMTANTKTEIYHFLKRVRSTYYEE